MTIVHVSKLLRRSLTGAHGSRYLSDRLRYVQEFPDAAIDNRIQRDHVIILPESNNDTSETNELLRLPKAGEPEIDFRRINAESAFKGLSKVICSFEDLMTDISNNEPSTDKPFGELMKVVERHLYPMDTAFNTFMCLVHVDKSRFLFRELASLLNRYNATRGKRLEAPLKFIVQDYARNHSHKMTDSERKLLKIYHPGKPSKDVIDQSHAMDSFYFDRNLKLNELTYLNRLEQTNSTFSYTVDDPDILAAVSSEIGPCEGLHHTERTPLKITESTYEKFMQLCPDRFVRQMLWQTRNKRCSPKGPKKLNNHQFINDLRVYRRHVANLRGFRTHVEFRLDDAMAKSKQQILDSLKLLREENESTMGDRLQELNDYADDNGGGNAEGIRQYDTAYWSHRYKHDILIGKSDPELRKYFPLNIVMRGLIQYFANYFGIEMVVRSDLSTLWDSSVQSIEVKRNNQPLGTILFDPYQRPMKHPCCETVRGRSSDLGCLPVRFMSLQFRRALNSDQAHLSISDIVSLFTVFSQELQKLHYDFGFHELNVAECIELDARGLMTCLSFAHFATDYRILQSCSDRGDSKPIDAELASRIIKSTTYFKSLGHWYGLYKAHLDLEVHTGMTDIKSLVKELYPLYSPFPREPDDFDYCSMSDVFAGPLDGHYYSLYWCRQLANFCLQHSLSGSGDIATSDVNKIREFNVKLIDALVSRENFDTSSKLLSLTGQNFDATKIGLGPL